MSIHGHKPIKSRTLETSPEQYSIIGWTNPQSVGRFRTKTNHSPVMVTRCCTSIRRRNLASNQTKIKPRTKQFSIPPIWAPKWSFWGWKKIRRRFDVTELNFPGQRKYPQLLYCLLSSKVLSYDLKLSHIGEH